MPKQESVVPPGMGRTHRHIAQNYLDLYAAEAAWTLGKGKKPVGRAFTELMTWMSKPRRSPLAGYFQGRKRFLPVCQPDGSVAQWKPAPRKGRIDFVKKGGKLIEFKPRQTREKAWREEWTFLSADTFLAKPDAVPNGPGVYALFARDETGLLAASGFVEQPDLPLWVHDEASHIYTGETYGIRGRLLEHLAGTVRESPLRETLLAVQFDLGWLPAAPAHEQRALLEGHLTGWMREHVVVGFKSCGYVRDMGQGGVDLAYALITIRLGGFVGSTFRNQAGDILRRVHHPLAFPQQLCVYLGEPQGQLGVFVHLSPIEALGFGFNAKMGLRCVCYPMPAITQPSPSPSRGGR